MIDFGDDGSFPRGGPIGLFTLEATLEGDPLTRDFSVELYLDHRDHEHKEAPWVRRHTLPITGSGFYTMVLDRLKKRLRFRTSLVGAPERRAELMLHEPVWRSEPTGEEDEQIEKQEENEEEQDKGREAREE